MLLKDLQSNNTRKMEKINKLLRERFGFSLASEIETGKLNRLYTKIADDLYNLKLDLSSMRDKEYTQKLLVAEGLKMMLASRRERVEELRESHLVGPGARRYEAALQAASADVEHACSVGDDYEEAIKDAMKAYRSSELRFPDEMFEFDLRDMTKHCTLDSQIAQYEGPVDSDFDNAPVEVMEDAGHSILDIITPEELDELRGYVNDTSDPMEFIGSTVYEKLFEYYLNSGEMPYGVAKARTGDPDQWILNRVQQDYAEEVAGVDEALGGPKGKAKERAWRDQVAQQKASGLGNFFADREHKDPQKKANQSPVRRVKIESKTTNRKEDMKEGYVKQLRKLLEAEVEQAESLIAARSFSQELQDMVEKLGRLVNEDLPAVAEQMRDAYGADIATGFENTVGETLSSVMDSLKGSKQDIDNSVASIADGQAPSTRPDMDDEDFGGDDELGDLDEPELDTEPEGELDLDLDDDDLAGLDDVGDDDLLGRAKKESVDRRLRLKKQIMEMQQKLARIKSKRSK